MKTMTFRIIAIDENEYIIDDVFKSRVMLSDIVHKREQLPLRIDDKLIKIKYEKYKLLR